MSVEEGLIKFDRTLQRKKNCTNAEGVEWVKTMLRLCILQGKTRTNSVKRGSENRILFVT